MSNRPPCCGRAVTLARLLRPQAQNARGLVSSVLEAAGIFLSSVTLTGAKHALSAGFYTH